MDLMGSQVPDAIIFLIIALACLLVLAVLVIWRMRQIPRPTQREVEAMETELNELVDEKAKLVAQVAVLEDGVKYGRVKPSERNEKVAKIEGQLKLTDASIDALIVRLASHRIPEHAEAVAGEVTGRITSTAEAQTEAARLGEKSKKQQGKIEEYYQKLIIYDLIVKRHAQHIESAEAKTINDMKAAVQPDHPKVKEIAERIEKESMEDCKIAGRKAYDYVMDIRSVPRIGISFWMTIDEVLENRVADYEDKAILLCSILRALDEPAFVVSAQMEDNSVRPLVIAELDGAYYVCDPNGSHDFEAYSDKTKEGALAKYSFQGEKIKKTLHEFNEKEYNEF
jgi:uncharacterized protein YoxC